MKVITKTLIFGLCALLQMQSAVYSQSNSGSSKIAKCQDENGKWHYGSANLHRCADSQDITTFNERGVLIDKQKRVKTEQELAAEKSQREQEAIALEEKRKAQLERDRILTVYQNEQDIENARQKKLLGIDRKIGQHQNFIEALAKQEEALTKKKRGLTNPALKKRTQAKIDEIAPKKLSSERLISELEKEKITSNKKYDEDLAFFKKNKS